ncbi:MAG: hypothetical protein FJ404_01420 [Verrucomicrobia bacterium]|nr:hypothetical protein [Verrucomicrobiota bacterium]
MINKPQSRLQQLRLILLATGIVVAAIYYGAIKPQQATIRQLESTFSDVLAKRESIRTMAMSMETNRMLLEQITTDNYTNESHMATGDVYFWMVREVEKYRDSHGIEFSQIDPPRMEPSSVLPKVPYESATLSVTGRADYAQFGHFLAAFENDHPLLRLRHLEIEPAAYGIPSPDEEGLVQFRVELSILVKPAEPTL